NVTNYLIGRPLLFIIEALVTTDAVVLLSLKGRAEAQDRNGGQDYKEAMTKNRNRSLRRAGACLPPIDGGHKVRSYTNMDNATFTTFKGHHTYLMPN
ncbi:MAG: hypothetical protein ACE5K8_02010, partial [Candidatus Zixiibacteriota bacterium]